MGVVLKPGQKKHGYEIVREISRGAYAIAYEANSNRGERVFLKQYKSPSCLVPWYDGFVSHQRELKRRIEADPAAKDRCYRFIEFFEENGFYQAFEFVAGGQSLAESLTKRSRFNWEQWVVFSTVMMLGVKYLHGTKIVHADLKPENVILIPDASIRMGYKLRLIDMDWSIFSDKPSPWHGHQGYVTTPGYESPEHLRGEVPLPASDVFTCGLILGEVLGDGHPFRDAGENYARAHTRGDFTAFTLRQALPKAADKDFVEAVVNACLNPDPAMRPSAAQVADALLGKTFPMSAYHPGPPHTKRAVAADAPAASVRAPSPGTKTAGPSAVELYVGADRFTSVGRDSTLGKDHFTKARDPDYKFLSKNQFRLFPGPSGWMIEHVSGATNETVVDGKRLSTALQVRDGMTVCVGNTAKGVAKFPLVLRLVNLR